jgi:glycosyltransferase involved in cell wall biosynthesis
MTLAIISHTEHYKTSDGTVVGWSPTVNEINHLLEVFDRIYHVAMLYDGEAPASTMAYTDDRVVLVPLRPSGGRSLLSKLHSIWQAPSVIRTVSKTLQKVDCFQLRTPTGIGVYLIPYLTLFSNKKGWYKYAGNWNQNNPPLGYRWQRFMLKQQKRKVTINGQWTDQPEHCITFENPCLTLADLESGKAIVKTKTVSGQLTFCFVGRLERAKGVEVIIKAFGMLTAIEKQRIDQVHFVGDGLEAACFKNLANGIADISFVFHGFLSRAAVFNIYEVSHFFMLPSMASEGFPKVIAEAMNFGCVPIVSEVSAITQYINATNGYVLGEVTVANLTMELKNIINLQTVAYRRLIEANSELICQFSFEHYNARIKTLITIL